ncbi:ABC-type transporter Mla maintaining outer membrane lipid asymmetry, component MlaD [Rhizobiales bacterium GAS188]|nr:ABC-type transporter Mla maintaining outer membrane lipid asymmetry, component MlaD [Rhizobiales bacterium GAS188]
METRAKYALIGLFTICVMAAAFGFVFWFSGSRGGANLKSYLVVFDYPVTGLSRGGSVLFNGIRVGEVTDLSIDPRNSTQVMARVDITPDVPIKESTKARLDSLGITGVATIQIFDSYSRSPDLKAKQDETMPTIRAVPSPTLQSVLETAQTAGRHADEILVKVNQIVADNQAPINRIVANVEKLSEALDAAKINAAVDNISAIAAKLDVDKLNHAIGAIDTAVSSLDTSTVNHTLKSIDSFATALGENADNLRALAKDAGELVAKLKGTANAIDVLVTTNSVAFNNAIANLDKVLASIDTAKVGRSIDGIDKVTTALGNHSAEIGDFIKDARELAASLNRSSTQVETFLNSGAPAALTRSIANIEDVTKHIDGTKLGAALDSAEKFVTALGDNTPRVNEIAKNANELFAKLDVSADKVDQILKGVDALVNSPDGKSAFVEFAEASRSVRKLADDLDKRSAELLTNLNKFSGSGLRDFQQFAIDGRRALGDISRTLQGVQRNPQQFIFGGKAALPEYGN